MLNDRRLVPLLPADTVMVPTGHDDGVSHVHLAGVQPLPSECHSLGPVGLVHTTNYVASFFETHYSSMKFTLMMEAAKFSDTQWRTQEFCSGGGGVQQIQLRTEDGENGDPGAVAPPSQGFWRQL